MASPVRQQISIPSTSTNYLRVAREQWLIIAISIVICVAAGIVSQQLGTKNYTAQADLLISPVDNADSTFVGISVFQSISADPTSNVLTLARYLNTPATAEVVRQQLHLSNSTDFLLRSISVQPLSQTNIVSVQASARSPKVAAEIANGFANATVTRRTAQIQTDAARVIVRLQAQITRSGSASSPSTALLQQRLAALRSLIGLPDPSLSVLNRAEIPTAPNKTSTKLIVIATALGGLLLGFGIALLSDSVGGKIRRENDLLLRDRLPILARVPRLSAWALREYFAGRTNLPPAAWEAYRTLRTNLLRSVEHGHTPVILVTSAMPGEGKTLTAVNLAVTFAAQDMRVLLVDGDFRRPMIASFFGIASPRDGFSSTFIKGNLKSTMIPAPGYANLDVLLPTLRDLSQIDQLDPERVQQVFTVLREHADVVVVDSAPAADVSDALVLASAADMVVLAVRIGYTRRDRFDALREALSQYGIAPSGLVVTTREPPKDAVIGSTMPVALDLKAPVRPRRPRRGESSVEHSERSSHSST